MFKKSLVSLFLLIVFFFCSEFNNPINQTYIFKDNYSVYPYKVTIKPSQILIQSEYDFFIWGEKDSSFITVYLKTDADFIKKYSSLNNKNANYKYEIFKDTIMDSLIDSLNFIRIFRLKIVLSSMKNNIYDTSYFSSLFHLEEIEIIINNEVIENTKQFLWQVIINERDSDSIYILPPEPYAYIN